MKENQQFIENLKRKIQSDPDDIDSRILYEKNLQHWRGSCIRCGLHAKTLIELSQPIVSKENTLILKCRIKEGQVWPSMFIHIDFNDETGVSLRINEVQGDLIDNCTLLVKDKDKIDLIQMLIEEGDVVIACKQGVD